MPAVAKIDQANAITKPWSCFTLVSDSASCQEQHKYAGMKIQAVAVKSRACTTDRLRRRRAPAR